MSLKYDFISSMCRETSWIMGTVGRVYTTSRAVLTHFEPNGGTDGIVIEHLMQIWVFRSITDIILYIVSEFCAKTSITQCARIFKGCQAIGAWGACQSAHTPSHCEVHNFLNNWSNWTKKTVPKTRISSSTKWSRDVNFWIIARKVIRDWRGSTGDRGRNRPLKQ